MDIHLSRMSVDPTLNIDELISNRELSGADLKALCTEAGLLALRDRRTRVTSEDFAKSKENVLQRKQENIPQGLYL